MITHVAKKEVREIIRDGRMRLLGVIVVATSFSASSSIDGAKKLSKN